MNTTMANRNVLHWIFDVCFCAAGILAGLGLSWVNTPTTKLLVGCRKSLSSWAIHSFNHSFNETVLNNTKYIILSLILMLVCAFRDILSCKYSFIVCQYIYCIVNLMFSFNCHEIISNLNFLGSFYGVK